MNDISKLKQSSVTAVPDYNIMSPDDMDELIFSAFDQALGEETRERLRLQYENYEYYDGKQHKDEYGNLVKADELERPPELDYDPTRYSTNYFKAVIDRKARWQMSGDHGIHVPRKTVDNPEDIAAEGYEPSEEQERVNREAQEYEELLQTLWRENRMRSRVIQAARDRLIADRVICKIVFNPKTGKLRWIWRPDTEFIPIYSEDDFEEMIAAIFVKPKKRTIKGKEVDCVQLQTFRMIDDETYIHEAVYRVDNLKKVEQILPTTDEISADKGRTVNYLRQHNGEYFEPMGLDFLPIVECSVEELVASHIGEGEISHLREQNDVLNRLNEDAIDSLKFEMFPMTSIINGPDGVSEKMAIAAGAVVELRGHADGVTPTIQKVESRFQWKEAYKDTYNRVKSAMHEVSGLPQIVPQELNFGGLNTDTLRILFHDIIADTEEHWLAWEYCFAELHEKSARYLQARLDADKFAYDKDVVRRITDYDSEMRFVLPLPDNRKELVQLLGDEVSLQFESKTGAMERLGVDNVQAKIKEIENETLREMAITDPYAGEAAVVDGKTTEEETKTTPTDDSALTRRDSNGELERICDVCGGTGTTVGDSGKVIKCPNCQGDGWVQVRKR